MNNKTNKKPVCNTCTGTKNLSLPSMNCGGKKRGCYVTMLPYFAKNKAA